MHLRKFFGTAIFIIGWSTGCLATPTPAVDQETTDEASSELSQEGSLVDFARDVYPILAEKCLECHGPEDAKNDFRVDDEETLLAYVEPGDVESSSLWADYLITDDPDMRMPPPDDPTQALTGVELATIKLWIEEGAKWSDPPTTVATDVVDIDIEPVAVDPPSTAYGIWIFQGLFHPATIHFPIALLTVSAGFVLLSFFRKKTCEPVAFHCLWIGAFGAIVACLSGWSYAGHEGYGMGFSIDLQSRAIDRHRWLGIAVAIVALILVPMASSVRRTNDFRLRLMWLLGSLLLLGGVSLVGYQGGELTYGEDHYWEEYERLFPQPPASEEVAADEEEIATEETASETAVDASPTELEQAVTTDGNKETASASETTNGAGENDEIESSSDAPPPGDPATEPEATKPEATEPTTAAPDELPPADESPAAAAESKSASDESTPSAEQSNEAKQEPSSERDASNQSNG